MSDSALQKARDEFEKWYESVPRPRPGDTAPAKGSIAVALVLLERLQTTFDLRLDAHLASGGAQIQGASGAAVRKILARFGETRPFVSEGGRTNRGSPTIAAELLSAIDRSKMGKLTANQRVEILQSLQNALVVKVQEFHNRERLKPLFRQTQSVRQFIFDLLAQAKETGKWGPVAQYVVGAKLQIRFPDIQIRNECYSAADDQSGHPGDFVVNDTSFHVTVHPTPGHFDKCQRNIRDGLRVYLLVPEGSLAGTRQNAELIDPGRIAVESIESFVGQNVEELSEFSHNGLLRGLRHLLQTYNARVDEVEIDKSMMVEVPRVLAQQEGDS